MTIGRPTKYRKEFAQIAYDTMAEGFSKTATAGKLGISRDTFHRWSQDNPDFSDAVKKGEAARTLWLESKLLEAPDSPTVTSRIFALKNAAPEEWRDVKDHNVNGTMKHKHEQVANDANAFEGSIAGLAAAGGNKPASGKLN